MGWSMAPLQPHQIVIIYSMYEDCENLSTILHESMEVTRNNRCIVDVGDTSFDYCE